MTFYSKYVGNSTKLDNKYAQIECVDDQTFEPISFIKNGGKTKIFPINLDCVSFIITNNTDYSILTGIYNYSCIFNNNGKITQGQTHELKAHDNLIIKISDLRLNSKFQFYTISSANKDVNNNTYIPSSIDEYLPFYLIQENIHIEPNKNTLVFENFEEVVVECVNNSTFDFTAFYKLK